MIKGIYTSASGMQYLQLKQEIIANNLANISTTGFKKEGVLRNYVLWDDKHWDFVLYSLLKHEW